MAVKAKKPGRALRVADQIARDIAELIPQNVRDPRVGLVTITGCEITRNFSSPPSGATRKSAARV